MRCIIVCLLKVGSRRISSLGRMPSFVLVVLAVAIIISAHPTHHSKRVKRIAFGRDLKSNSIFGTQFFVEIKHTFNCLVNHHSHEFLTDLCLGRHICGGSLIHPQFVMTAAHCLTYVEYAIKEITDEEDYFQYDLPELPPDDSSILTRIQNSDLYKLVKQKAESGYTYVKSKFVVAEVSKPKHTVYTDYLLLAGGTNDHEMKQTRHTHHIFPHPDWISRVEFNNDPGNTSRTDTYHVHDFLIIQACEPFKIDKNVKLAQLGSKIEMQSDYERIVKLGLVCLYIGLGYLDEDEWVKYARPPYKEEPYSNWTQYTWRPSQCYSGCNRPFNYHEELVKFEHTCHLCSTHQGSVLNEFLSGDSGSPVICDGKLTAVVANGFWKPEINISFASSYAIHCSRNMITKRRLEYYLTLKPNPPYHPLGASRKHKSMD